MQYIVYQCSYLATIDIFQVKLFSTHIISYCLFFFFFFLAVLQFLSIGPDLIAIWGLKAKRYLAVDHEGKIYATVSVFFNDYREKFIILNIIFTIYNRAHD